MTPRTLIEREQLIEEELQRLIRYLRVFLKRMLEGDRLEYLMSSLAHNLISSVQFGRIRV
jgi:hypothetical protein